MAQKISSLNLPQFLFGFGLVGLSVGIGVPANCQEANTVYHNRNNYASLIFGGSIGIAGKVGIVDRISLRPFLSTNNILGGGKNYLGMGIAYDFTSANSQLRPYVGTGLASVERVDGTFSTSSSRTTSSIDGFVNVGIDYFATNYNVLFNVNATSLGIVNMGIGFSF